MEACFELEHTECCCAYCQSWAPRDSAFYGECLHWHQIMIDAGFHASIRATPPVTYEDGWCPAFASDYGSVKSARDADYTRPGAI